MPMWPVLRPGTQWLADSSRHRPRACSYAAALAYLELWLYTERSPYLEYTTVTVGSPEMLNTIAGGARVNMYSPEVRVTPITTVEVSASTTLLFDTMLCDANVSEANNVLP